MYLTQVTVPKFYPIKYIKRLVLIFIHNFFLYNLNTPIIHSMSECY
jgi:hypothetical protein